MPEGADQDEAPGWDAIEAAFLRLYPGQDDPSHWATVFSKRVALGGPEALDGVSAYEAREPAPHWPWLTFGLTELYEKVGEDPERSGWGYELTMRVPARDGEPGTWALHTLQNVANWAHRTERVLRAGQAFDTGKPIVGDEPCDLTGMAFAADSALPPLDTPHGRVELVELIALRPEEAAFAREHGVEELVRAAGRSYTGEFNVLRREPFVG